MNYYLKLLKKFVNKHKDSVVCFDFFDTIVSRCISPDEIKKTWAKNCSKYLFNNTFTWKELFLYRIKLEAELYNCKENNYEFKYNDLMVLVYNELIKRINGSSLNVDLDRFIAFSNKCEIEIEKSTQYINYDILQLIQYCHDEKIEIIIISDYYFGEKYILEYLKKFQISTWFSKIFVSCDCLLSKRTGDIYEYVKRQFPLKSFIMIGDNKTADEINSNNNGFFNILINRKSVFKTYREYDNNSKSYISNKLIHLSSSNGTFLSNYAFTLYLFIERLYSETYHNNVDELFFLARDSEFLQILFEEYKKTKNFNKEVKTNYLLVSRNSTYIASCKSLDLENFDGIFSHYEFIKLTDFLISLSFSGYQLRQVLFEMKCNEDFCFSRDDYFFIESLKKCSAFRKYYDANRNVSKQIFTEYLLRETDNIDQINIVDVGWRGTIQDNMLFAINKCKQINGYYYGLTEKQNISSLNSKKGLMFSCDRDFDAFGEVYEFEYWFLEDILTGSHGKVEGYKYDNDRIIPVLRNDSDIVLFEKYIFDLRKEIIKKFKTIDEIISNSHYTAEDFSVLFSKIHFRVSRLFPILYKKDNYTIRYLHSEGFGLVTSETKIPNNGWNTYFLKEYGSSYIYRIISDYRMNIINLRCKDFIDICHLILLFFTSKCMETITALNIKRKSSFNLKRIKRSLKSKLKF